MSQQDKQQLNEILHDDHKADDTVKRAVAEALRRNKERGNRVPVWDGQEIVFVEPDQIPTEEPKDPR